MKEKYSTSKSDTEMLSVLFLQTGTLGTPTKELRYKIWLPRLSHFRESFNTHIPVIYPLDLLFTKEELTRLAANSKLWLWWPRNTGVQNPEGSEEGRARKKSSRVQSPHFRKANSGLFKKPVGGNPWQAALKGRAAQERWQGFNSSTLQAQVQSIPILGKTNRLFFFF